MPDLSRPDDGMPAIDADDRFATEDFIKHYDPSRIYTRASDDKGHSTLLRVPLPNHVASMLRAFVASPLTPHRSMNDAIRDALYHWCYWWAEELRKSPGKPPVPHPSIALTEIERIRERDELNRQVLDDIASWYHRGVDPADWDEFQHMLSGLAEMVNTSQAKDYERLLAEIDRDRNR